MAVIFIFVLGVVNFALHGAVLDSKHRLLGQVPWFVHMLGGRGSLVVEFLMLLGAMLLGGQGATAWVWGYAAYSAINGLSAWLILTDRI